MSILTQRPTMLAWFFFIAGLITTVSLGIWQVQRLSEKEALIARIEAAQASEVSDIPTSEAELMALEFHRVKLTGTWLPEHEFHIAARYYKSEVGYHILTPLLLDDGRIALVNRGWVSADKKESDTRPQSAVSGKEQITAMLRIGADRNYFTPPSQPEKNMWFGRDVSQMAAHANLDRVIPATFDAIFTPEKGVLPVPSSGEIKLRNDHLSYIITWFGIALGMVVIFVLAHRPKRR